MSAEHRYDRSPLKALSPTGTAYDHEFSVHSPPPGITWLYPALVSPSARRVPWSPARFDRALEHARQVAAMLRRELGDVVLVVAVECD